MDFFAFIVVFSPLIGAFIAGFFGRMIGDKLSDLRSRSSSWGSRRWPPWWCSTT